MLQPSDVSVAEILVAISPAVIALGRIPLYPNTAPVIFVRPARHASTRYTQYPWDGTSARTSSEWIIDDHDRTQVGDTPCLDLLKLAV